MNLTGRHGSVTLASWSFTASLAVWLLNTILFYSCSHITIYTSSEKPHFTLRAPHRTADRHSQTSVLMLSNQETHLKQEPIYAICVWKTETQLQMNHKCSQPVPLTPIVKKQISYC